MGIQVKLDLNGDMAAHVLEETGKGGAYADAVAYLRDLILRDMATADAQRSMKEHLRDAFAVPDSECSPFDADAFRERMRERHGR